MAIKIKPSKKGSFTKWAKKKGLAKEEGGVTAEAIAAGKKSKNPKIRKKATFAASSRKWAKKRKTGG